MDTKFYVEIYESGMDTTDKVSEFSELAAAEEALRETCRLYEDRDNEIVAAVIHKDIRNWDHVKRDAEYPHAYQTDGVFTALLKTTDELSAELSAADRDRTPEEIERAIRAEMARLDYTDEDVRAMHPDLAGEDLLEMLIGAEPSTED